MSSIIVGGKRILGVAVILKDLLSVFDQLSIDHPSEAALRRILRHRRNVITSANQKFLSNDSDDKIRISNSRHYSCIILPKDDIPNSFFEHLSEGLYP